MGPTVTDLDAIAVRVLEQVIALDDVRIADGLYSVGSYGGDLITLFRWDEATSEHVEVARYRIVLEQVS